MDWWKLFSGTFVLIFLAELGDKTQLAALAKTADSPDSSMAKWVVFLAASAALVFSTFIAVFLGHILKSLVPDERYIRAAAAILFLIFGVMILYEIAASLRGEKAVAAVPPAAATAKADAGYAGRLALAGAMEFETLAADRYRRLAPNVSDARLKDLLLGLAREEDRHLAGLKAIPDRASPPPPESARFKTELAAAKLPRSAGDREILAELIRHEEATAEFYLSLAKRSVIPSVKNAFLRLAEDETSHARRLAELMPV